MARPACHGGRKHAPAAAEQHPDLHRWVEDAPALRRSDRKQVLCAAISGLVRRWRATVDEDGHYSFAVALCQNTRVCEGLSWSDL